ncbi:hypothetical protein [Rhizobium laguerreae]|uniref:hypothetical protein n=1 Tax=Rhizobium laguerreae TaxID=1076926 RepID=UPI001C91FE62|nr:hypothetical protein [Rhizobium laguerreae]MBY3372608.1 hypothetical protein [Rhizobium laguerreae]MBY3427775.1 hypothetical protein [Rhizobium laguerreae]MBY3436785.1 hypothetical protein [Rhizobium laguerreae]MBY3450927.1 hypothetical protein [Rhizobium laguerreae]
MAKNTFLSWSTTAGANTDVGGVYIGEGCPPSNMNNSDRTIMAILRRDLDNGLVYSAKAGAYTAVADDNNGAIRFTATATLSLTAAATLGADWHVTVIASGGDVTIDPNGAETIDGAATLVIPDGGSAEVFCGGSAFYTDGLAQLRALVTLMSDGWGAFPIGVPVPVMTHKGVSSPPTNKSYRYVKLTAADAYNTGFITSESVSGTAPLLIATGVVSLAGSPLDGQTINLWNSEGRIPRAGSSAGTLQNDAFQDHGHPIVGSDGAGGGVAVINGAGGGFSPNNKTSAATTATTGGTPRTANETRMKNEAVTYYMRIK